MQREHVPNLAFSWEGSIPFLPWTILPYWSINAFYGLSLFINDTTEGVDRLAKRYLTVQLVAVSCFIVFPLTATFERPPTSGLPGFMFDVLGGFDKPFNQAPSLHIALLVIIWDHLRRRIARSWRWFWHGWCALIGLSVLTTWQHHVIDMPTGALLGLFALWLIPVAGTSPAAGFKVTANRKARTLAIAYGCGVALFLALTVLLTPRSGAALLLLWPALALAIVAYGYLGGGPAVFQKGGDGRVTLASLLLLMPYRLGAWLNIAAWTRKLPSSVPVAAGVHLGRFPTVREYARFASVVDMTSEFPGLAPPPTVWVAIPALDLLPLDRSQQLAAASAIETARERGPVLVCCALGFQRSAVAVASWLMATGRAQNAAEAIRMVGEGGRRIHLTEAMIGSDGDWQ
ncbi:phosphatase PAP2/dual specificity phosphatase family protein (plasmid) [Sinorhizobium sp. BG8]|nr:phosphatase PAP2/dual specificity phosphatase family protein [Sinorhizobium sp. BG8]